MAVVVGGIRQYNQLCPQLGLRLGLSSATCRSMNHHPKPLPGIPTNPLFSTIFVFLNRNCWLSDILADDIYLQKSPKYYVTHVLLLTAKHHEKKYWETDSASKEMPTVRNLEKTKPYFGIFFETQTL